MKIWLATSYEDHGPGNDCDDCSGSRKTLNAITWPPTASDILCVQTLTLETFTPLYIQQCGGAEWLVCNPTGSGHVAVLDEQAMALLTFFHSPMMNARAIHATTGWPLEMLQSVITLFYYLGFLRDALAPSPPYNRKEPETLTAWVHVTNDCNLRCHYCYVQKTHESMAIDVGRKAIASIFRSAHKHDIQRIQLKYAGGEASLHMMNVFLLHDYAEQLAQMYGITVDALILSNGVALSQRAIEQLKARNIAITISLDGLDIYHDSQRPLLNGKASSKYVLRTINRLLANNLLPFISITISQRSLAGLPELMYYILQQNLPFSLSYYRENDCSAHLTDLQIIDEQIIAAMHAVFALIEKNLPARSLLGSLLDKADMSAPHRTTCGVGQNYLVIDQNGGVAKCQMDIKRPVTTIASDDPLHMIREDRQGIQGLDVENKEGCRDCSWRYWCTGGCPMLTYRATGRYDRKSPNCNIYKALFPEVLRLEALRLLRYNPPLVLNDQ